MYFTFFWRARNLVTSNTKNLSFSCRTPLLMLCKPQLISKEDTNNLKKTKFKYYIKQVKDFVSQIRNNSTNFIFRLSPMIQIKKIKFFSMFLHTKNSKLLILNDILQHVHPLSPFYIYIITALRPGRKSQWATALTN